MSKRLISILLLISLFSQFGCGTMYNISKEDFAKRYTDKKGCPSILIRTKESSSYKFPYDSYYLKSDTIYYGAKVVNDSWEEYIEGGNIAMQDVESIKFAETNLLFAPVVFLVGAIVFIGIFFLVAALGGGPLRSWN